MMTSVLPLISPEKGTQLGFVAQGTLLVVSGVYYPVEVLPEWMQWIAKFSPATYALEGIREAILEGAGLSAAVGRDLAAARHRRRLDPARPLGLPPGRAVCEAPREAEEVGMTEAPYESTACSRSSTSPSARRGSRPRRRASSGARRARCAPSTASRSRSRPGEIVGFLGPNGAGKTTTLKMLSGLLYVTRWRGARARTRAVEARARLPPPDLARDGQPEPAAVGSPGARLVRAQPLDLPDPPRRLPRDYGTS